MPASAEPTTVTKGTFANSEEFEAYMNRHGIDTSMYGQGKAKTVLKLFKEVELKVRARKEKKASHAAKR